MRILGDRKPLGQDSLTKLVAQPGRAARHHQPIRGLCQMADQARSNTFVVKHGIGPRRRFAHAAPRQCALAGDPPHFLGIGQVAAENAGVAVIVPLHRHA